MPTSYERALEALLPDHRNAIGAVCAAWLLDATLGPVSRNILDETALEIADFLSLLTWFATELANAVSPQDAWKNACRQHKLRGRQISADRCPVVLGRVRTLNDHAKSIANSSTPRLTQEEAKRLLLKYANSSNLRGFEAILRAASLGNFFIWATFDLRNSGADPFDSLPNSRPGICTALGLGGPFINETLVLLAWNHADSGLPPLYRPTVADAEDNAYYRPFPEAHSPWGFTQPLPPNPDNLLPQPEVVMREMSSLGLRLPFRTV